MVRLKTNTRFQYKLVIAILILGVVLTSLLFLLRPRAEKQITPVTPPSVSVVPVVFQSVHIPVYSQGNVEARTRINLAAEVAGRIVELTPALRDGARFRRGELLLRIDDRDYSLAMQGAEAQVAAAQQALARTEAEAEQARFDVQRMGRTESEATDYALRLPHLKEARARLKAARADLAMAELQHQRTRVHAPFDGRVIRKKVDVGQYVAPGQVLADIYASEHLDVRLPLTQAQWALLAVPDAAAMASSSHSVWLSAELGGEKTGWAGRIVRTESIMDSRNQLLYAVVEIDRTQTSEPANAAADALLTPGLFVRAVIRGRPLTDMVVLPRAALRQDDQVWLLTSDNSLRIQRVHVLHKDETSIYVDQGLAQDARVIVSALDLAVEGMPLRVMPEIPGGGIEAVQ